LFFRLFPIFPFNLNNLGFGLTNIKIKTYIFGTFIGIIPWVFIYAFFGNALAELNIGNIVISIALVIVFTIIYLIVRKHWKK
jgi:uncharacterized membrane protein YdjX (TVP38/TMEM64 family)